MNPTLISYKSIPNIHLANQVGLSEGAIRAQKRNKDKSAYEANVEKYIVEVQPFIPVELYAKHKYSNISLNELENQIKNNEIPFLKHKTDETLFVPYNLTESQELKEDMDKIKKAIVLSTANTSGGAGKTTNSINLGTFLAFLGYNVLFVDFDTQSNASQRFGLRPEIDFKHSIIDLIIEVGRGAENCEELVKDSIVSLTKELNTKGKFDVLPNSGKHETVKKLTYIEETLRLFGTAYKSLDMTLDMVKNEYDFILIDTAPSISTPMTIAALATDYFLLSYRPEDKAYAGVPMLLAKLKEEIEPVYKMHKKGIIKVIGGIITDFDPKVNIQKDNIEIICEDFMQNNALFMQNTQWTVFPEIIQHLSKFETIKLDAKGTLIHPNSLNEPIDRNIAQAIKHYLTICTKLIERIIIDKFENNEIE